MKRSLLLLFFPFFLFSCDMDEEPKVFSANATLYIDSSGVDNCKYALQTADKQWFAMERIPGELQGPKINVAIEFRKTNENLDCGFGGSLPKILILDLQVIQEAEPESLEE